MKFFSPEVALYIYKSTICPCMECCCHTWAGAPNYNLGLLDKLKNEYVGLLVLHLLLLLNTWLIVKMWPAYIFSIGTIQVDVLQNWLNWFHFLFLEEGLLIILIDCMIFWSPFLDVTRISISTVSFLCTTWLWSFLPIECFPLTYNLNDCKSRINRHLLTVGSFRRYFLYGLILLCFYFF